ncbi:putative ATP-dependent RNA helicase ucp12 [Cyphellophora attinorum]|uniref:Putative ATP-dependent RNA helicase ucp12 n=1 Tax=Cyphellophora attinorum TaxID=1664694 RepID=A0A0N1NYB3_9EURO|nr:putative ATP-dependent RNA helicase ucp12 [Phialophora attinorum]KPI38394.1 putative ATP-dependent RNA helicase ucp12 [Phialophora attinorum]
MAPRKGHGKESSAKTSAAPAGGDNIVFTNAKGDVRIRGPKSQKPNDEPAAPKVDVKKVIGGASWTGKLPVNLLSEHCQREKWNRPDYSMRSVQVGEEKMHRSTVRLSKTDPKTKETTTLPYFELPSSQQEHANEPTPLEARHFAATYALYRVASMKQIHMALPPKYRDFWKGLFAELKKEDVKEGRGWKYEADPFAAEAKRREIHAAMDKRKQDQEKKAALQAASVANGTDPQVPNKAFARAPRIELGEVLRSELEDVVRLNTTWNKNKAVLSNSEKIKSETDLIKSGFRPTHVREALTYVGSHEEAIEWLLIHVPEDDLPKWAMPTNYSAGVTLASSNPTREAKLKRLSRAGYSTSDCAMALRQNNDNETEALEALQTALVPSRSTDSADSDLDLDIWEQELATLEAIHGEAYTSSDPSSCAITIQFPGAVAATLSFHQPREGYPERAVPLLVIDMQVPAYVRLSVLRQALDYAWENLLGDQMIYGIIEWLQAHVNEVVADPGRLVDIEIASGDLNLSNVAAQARSSIKGKASARTAPDRTKPKDSRSNEQLKQAWEERQSSSNQQQMLKARQSLPAWQKRHDVVEAIKSKQVTLITGETGSGKSTQSLQFVLDDAIQSGKGKSCSMICTQPRRVAALSLSDRVSAERCSPEGDEVGYIIRGASRTSPRTKITFMTTGVLLRRLQQSNSTQSALEGISHVFVDEVHERSLDTDFLLALLKDTMRTTKLKIVLMSATVDADVFSNYFGGPTKVARIHIEGRTFPVQDVYLDHILAMTGHVGTDEDEDDYGRSVGKAIQSLGSGINYDLIAALVTEIDGQLGKDPGAILIFLPGTLEIDRCLRAVSRLPNAHALPLHASLMPTEQKRVFPAAPRGMRKIICATNVAETSITISDIVAVIDTGRVKETSYDISSNVVRLQDVWASKAQCKQRRGRAGRVQAGTDYKLYTQSIETSMRQASEPEMQRVPLEQLCLNVKATAPEADTAAFLKTVISPPDSAAVSKALRMLHRMGALEENRLTGLGTYMSMLPTDLRCAKLIIYGTIFSCLESTLTIASILTVKSPFVSPRDKREEANAARATFSTSDGDLSLELGAFNAWKTKLGNTPSREISNWCSSNFLSQQTLRDIDSTRIQLMEALKEADLVPAHYNSRNGSATEDAALNANLENRPLLRALIAGALSPNIAEIKFPEKKFMASMTGAKELDPEARTIKFFTETSNDDDDHSSTSTASTPSTSTNAKPTQTAKFSSERVFIHPSSSLFTITSFPTHSHYLSYFTKLATSKTFIRDLTPLNAYSLLLFGGKIEVDPTGAGITVDGWLRMRGWARIGVLVRRLRGVLDEELRRRVDGGGDGDGDDKGRWARVLGVVRRLVELNGQDR